MSRLTGAIRIGVIIAATLLFAFGPESVRAHPAVTLCLVAVAWCYGVTTVCLPRLERIGTREAMAVGLVDAVVATELLASTGGSTSPAVAILFLVVVSGGIRIRLRGAVVLTLAIAAATFMVGMLANTAPPVHERLGWSAWWSGFLFFTGLLAAGITFLAERQQEQVLGAQARAQVEHDAAEYERELRDRLLASYQAQQDGLRIILHEFRTPVASLSALGSNLVRKGGTEETRHMASVLVASHVEHLAEMLDGLADVARMEGSPLGTPRRREVDLEQFLLAAADAAGLRPPQLHLVVTPANAQVVVDVRLRRVITNLADNAVRHSESRPIDITARAGAQEIEISVADRGPGLRPEQLAGVTEKYVSLGDSRGTAGLGLWIVEQITRALGGHLYFRARDGGGLRVDLTIPR
ncbi:sensor histidine kinase [Amycolatopsis acididurans]|uniref:sensor histidine kinase n=1 Tax=Amycolatopsis acididurans TaxID=2724524 RepID=UPI001444ED6C|nr:HAMP domain-containing sensor histidine kinase [Amycolatopsis acididurans]